MPVPAAGLRPPPGAGRRPRLVGRAAELEVLAGELTRARRGEFRCVLLVGEPGVGKTRLAEEVGHRAPDTVVLSARGYSLGSAASFGLWAEAIDRHLHRLGPAVLAELARGPVADLAPVVGAVAAARPAGSPPGTAPDGFERTRLIAAWAELFRRLARRSPLVVELDDVALADASSLYLLGSLARTCADAAVLVVATTRPSDLFRSGALLEVVHALEQDGVLRRLPVRPLDRAAVGELAADVLAAPPSSALVDWLVVQSGGNPLFAAELVRALPEQGGDLTVPPHAGVPPVLAERIQLRLSRLTPATLGVVEWLAVLGRRVEPAALAAVSGVDRGLLVDALAELVRAGLVAEPAPGRPVVHEIAHPLVAAAVYDGLGAARRTSLHRQAGRALLASGQLGAAAGHVARSAEPGDDEAVRALHAAMLAAERAEAHPEAGTILSALVEVLPGGDPRWADVVAALRWDASWVVDHAADSHMRRGVEPLQALDRAVAGLADPGPRAQVKLRLAIFLAWGGNRLAEAEVALQEAVGLFAAAGDRRGELLATHEQAWIRMLRGGTVAQLQAAAEQVAAAARAADDPLVASRADRTIGTAAIFRGRFATGDAALGRTLTAARLSGNPHREAMAVLNQAISLLFRGRVAEALPVLGAAAALAGGGSVATRASTAALEMFLRWLAGDVRGAVRVAEEHESTADEAGMRTGWGWAGAAAAAAEAGRGAESTRWLRRARDLFPDGQFGFFTAFLDYGAGACAAAGGRPQDAIGSIRPAVDRLLGMGADLPAVAALVDLAEISGQCRLPDAGAAARLAAIAASTGQPAHRALADLAAGWRAFGAGDPAAVPHAEAAVEALDRLGWTWQLARAQVLLARVAGPREVVVASLEGAVAGFTRCGAEARRERARAALLHQGSSGRRAAAAAGGPATLTPREREVARRTVGGRSARQIAAELFITPRTVEGHLARVYARLGVHSKVELAARAAEFGLTGDPVPIGGVPPVAGPAPGTGPIRYPDT